MTTRIVSDKMLYLKINSTPQEILSYKDSSISQKVSLISQKASLIAKKVDDLIFLIGVDLLESPNEDCFDLLEKLINESQNSQIKSKCIECIGEMVKNKNVNFNKMICEKNILYLIIIDMIKNEYIHCNTHIQTIYNIITSKSFIFKHIKDDDLFFNKKDESMEAYNLICVVWQAIVCCMKDNKMITTALGTILEITAQFNMDDLMDDYTDIIYYAMHLLQNTENTINILYTLSFLCDIIENYPYYDGYVSIMFEKKYLDIIEKYIDIYSNSQISIVIKCIESLGWIVENCTRKMMKLIDCIIDRKQLLMNIMTRKSIFFQAMVCKLMNAIVTRCNEEQFNKFMKLDPIKHILDLLNDNVFDITNIPIIISIFDGMVIYQNMQMHKNIFTSLKHVKTKSYCKMHLVQMIDNFINQSYQTEKEQKFVEEELYTNGLKPPFNDISKSTQKQLRTKRNKAQTEHVPTNMQLKSTNTKSKSTNIKSLGKKSDYNVNKNEYLVEKTPDYIDDKTKHIVNGFIKTIQNSYKISRIP
eukprot:181422_1